MRALMRGSSFWFLFIDWAVGESEARLKNLIRLRGDW